MLAALTAGVAAYLTVPPSSGRSSTRTAPRAWWHRVGTLRRRTASHQRRDRECQVLLVIEFCVALAAEIRAGRPPESAWSELWPQSSLSRQSSAVAASSGANVVETLRSSGRGRGRGGLVRIAACWEVAEHSGAGLVAALEQVAASLRADREIAAEIDGQLAGARATGRLLVALPVLAVVLGQALGARPLQVLATTWYGWLCLLLGVALSVLGSLWVEQQIRAASPWQDR